MWGLIRSIRRGILFLEIRIRKVLFFLLCLLTVLTTPRVEIAFTSFLQSTSEKQSVERIITFLTLW